MRLALLALLLSGCGDDLLSSEQVGPSRKAFCTQLANQQEHGFEENFYFACMYGHARPGDGGAD